MDDNALTSLPKEPPEQFINHPIPRLSLLSPITLTLGEEQFLQFSISPGWAAGSQHPARGCWVPGSREQDGQRAQGASPTLVQPQSKAWQPRRGICRKTGQPKTKMGISAGCTSRAQPSSRPRGPWHVALPFAHSPGSGCCWAVSGCSVHADGVPGEPQAPQRSSAECHGVGLCLSAAVTRGLQASFGRIIYTNIYISCLAGKALRCSSCTVGKRK